MKILLLINWKIKYCDAIPEHLQPSDYNCPEEPFWFFKYFAEVPKVDVVDIGAPTWIEKIENKIRFHFYQTLKVLPKIKQYDLIFVHGSNSAMLLGAIKRIFRIQMPPILDVDISSFHQASKSGMIHRLSQFSSKAFDYMVYHTSSQIDYYKVEFPWLVNKCEFIPLGVDYNYWKTKQYPVIPERKTYIVCVGYRKRDWNTLLKAYNESNIDEELYLIGNPDIKCDNPKVKVLPFIPISELMTYITNAKFSVIPLDDFNYSFAQLTLLQQMACILLPAQKENVILEATIISAVANVLLNFILISTWKENATAFTTLVAEGIMLGICGWKSREICKVKVFNKNLLTVCVGTAAVVGICFTVRMAKFQSTVELLISVVLSGIAYFIVLIALKNENNITYHGGRNR